MDKFVVNIIHRPEMVPEYAEKVTGHGKAEDIGRKALLTESLDIFKAQQRLAHENGLKPACLTKKQLPLPKQTMKHMGMKLPFLCWGCPVKNFVRNIRPKISVSGCFPWKIKNP